MGTTPEQVDALQILGNIRARRRQVRTPSATQILRPIYRTSIAQWRHYETQLAPVLPLLGPWVRKFSYEAATG